MNFNMITDIKHNFWLLHHNRGVKKKIYEKTVKSKFDENLRALSNKDGNNQFDLETVNKKKIPICLNLQSGLKAAYKSRKSELNFKGKARLQGLKAENILDYYQSIVAVEHLKQIILYDGTPITIEDLKRDYRAAQKELEAENKKLEEENKKPKQIITQKIIRGYRTDNFSSDININSKQENKILPSSSTSNKKNKLKLASPPTISNKR